MSSAETFSLETFSSQPWPVTTFLSTMINLGILALVCFNRLEAAPSPFSQGHETGYLKSSEIDDASGLAASRIHKNILYTLNDHSSTRNENRIFAIDARTGDLKATYELSGVNNDDWEDLAVGPCGSKTCIYVGNTGAGLHHHPANKIFRFEEPTQLREEIIPIKSQDQFQFTWHEPESECLMVDDIGDVYIVSRVKYGHAMMARIPFHAWGETTPVSLTVMARINIQSSHHDPRGCDISPDGKGMLIKAEEHMFYWPVTNRKYLDAVQQTPITVPYHQEQAIASGQSVAWAADGSGYYTLSEGTHSSIYFYPKKSHTA